ncbi:MAG: DUF1653 domain-containing protein [Bacillota bacterium]|nr:DUF1653 domain-containing protein [Bacillota bacterium]
MTKYQHYKGGIYTLLSTSVWHTETNERLAVYENSEGKTFARPYDMFFGKVVVDGEEVPRFKEIDNKTTSNQREYPTLKGKDAEVFLKRNDEHLIKAKLRANNYMNTLLTKYGREK